MSSSSLLMTLPKYVAIPNKNGLPIAGEDSIGEFLVCGKKRRLDHLSWEEKLQRKKLKNRVAAQTSRDRKKAKMDEMDLMIKQLTDENISLKSQFSCLTYENKELMRQNQELELRLNEIKIEMELRCFGGNANEIKRESHETSSTSSFASSMSSLSASPTAERWIGCGITNENGSAASAYPLQKGTLVVKPQSMQRADVQRPQQRHHQSPKSNKKDVSNSSSNSNFKDNSDSAALWKIIALCLLYRTCSKISMPADLKNLPKVCSQMSQQTLKMMLQEAAMQLPKLKANQSQCLDQWWGPKQKSWNPAKISMEA